VTPLFLAHLVSFSPETNQYKLS